MTKLPIAGFLLLASGLSTIAQQPAGTSQTVPDSGAVTLKVQTRLTVEDVTVTDGKGNAVRGLTQADFTVKEDGKPQAINNFQEYGTEQSQAAPPQSPANVEANRQAANPSAVNILLLDSVATGLGGGLAYSPQNVPYAKQQAIKYLKTMPERTQVAILQLSNGLRVVQGFTSDRNVLLAAIDSVKPGPAAGAYLPPRVPGDPPPPLEEVCAVANAQSDITTAALAGIADFVSGIKGRKNLIWFTPGVPWLTDYGRFSRVPCLRDDSPQLHNAYGLLTAARVAVYPIDPRGLEACGPGGDAIGSPTCTMGTQIQDHGSVLDIANSTGGKAYYNRNDLDAAIGEAIANGSDYYSLSYVPPLSKYDGKHHAIEVKVDRPGLHLLYREGYTAVDITQPLAKHKNAALAAAPPMSGFHAAMGYGKPDAAELPFNVTVQLSIQPSQPGGSSGSTALASLNPRFKGTPLVPYDVVYKLPAGDITLTSDDPSGIQKGSLEFLVAAFSADGELLNSLDQTATYTIKPDQLAQFRQMQVRVPAQLDLPLGKVFIRAGVLDVSSQKMGIKQVSETVTLQSSPETASPETASPAAVTQQSAARTASPAKTAKILSVAQIEQLFASSQDKTDGKVAKQLMGVELSERVSRARMTRWEKDFPGIKTREQLMKLADRAAFFNPPQEEVIHDPVPDAATQTKIFALAVDFAKTTFTHLPNFYAARTTIHFDDEPEVEWLTTRGSGATVAPMEIFVNASEARPLRVTRTYSMTVTFQKGSEVHEKAGKGSKPEPSHAGLRTNGEFGPILGIVLGDAIRGQSVTWSRWERGESGPIAIFRYLVPQDQSTYATQIPDRPKSIELHPGYHGEIAIDPATGSILRISVVTDMAPPHQAIAMAMLIEYAPVTMGGHTYICPVHGVAYSKVPLTTLGPVQLGSRPAGVATAFGETQNAVEIDAHELNDTVFTQYHRFGAEVKIVEDGTPQPDGNSP